MTIGSCNISVYDIFYFGFILSFLYVAVNFNKTYIYSINKIYLYFIFILVISLFYGITKFGMRALGEGRYIYGAFSYFVPISLFWASEYKTYELIKFLKKIIYLSAISSLLLFIIEVINGGRFFFTEANSELIGIADFRGTRYLGSEETYNIMLLAIFFFISNIYYKNKKYTQILASIILFVIVIFTKNRTASIALGAGLFFTIAITDRKIIFTYFLGLLLAVYTGLSLFSPEILDKISLAFNVIDIKGDETGSWRYYVQYSAIMQGLKFPIFGEGFGGYFSIYIPEWGKIVELPPHNIFIYLFMKSGLIGVVSSITMLISLISALFKNRHYWFLSNYKDYYLLFLTILISQFLYGMAYGFSLYFSLFAGFALLINYKLKNENKVKVHE